MLTIRIIALVCIFISRIRFPRNIPLCTTIRMKYGNESVKLMRRVEKLDWKYRKTLLNIEFLTNCHNNDVIPHFLDFKVTNKMLRSSSSYHQCQLLLLNQEITNQNDRLRTIRVNLDRSQEMLKAKLVTTDYIHVLSITFASNNTRVEKEQARLDEKVSTLLLYKECNKLDLNCEKIVKNYSDHELTDTEKTLLSKGLNFAVLPSRLNYADYCLNFELFYREICNLDKVNNRNKDFLHSKLKDIALTSFREYHDGNNDPNNLSTAEFKALKRLADKNDLVIQKADKGNCIVIINKSTYFECVKSILSDTSKFEAIKFKKDEVNHIIAMEKKIRGVLDDLHRTGKISKQEHVKMLPIGSRPGTLYGLAKVHKNLVNGSPPFRPILSAIGTPTYHLSKFLIPIMTPIALNEYTIKNTFHFAREVVEQDASLFMSSLDIEALFTSIPLDETINIAVEELYREKDEIKNLKRTDFKALLEIATKESCFIFDGKYYSQTDGVAMGNPLGPTMANIFMCHFEKKWLPKCPPECKPVYYRRYVDDTFVLFKKEEHLQSFKAFLNSCHPNIRFTHENEESGSLPFLDIKIFRENDKFCTTVYRKKTFTGLYSNFKSLIPTSYKKGLVLTLLFRIHSICSNWTLIHFEISKLTKILIFNGYPLAIIVKCIRQFLDKMHEVQQVEEDTEEEVKTISLFLPYLGEISRKLKRSIMKQVKKNIPNCKVRVIFSAKRRIRNFFRFKDVIPRDIQSHLVYKITCAECNLCYYGLTERHFKVRAYDHLGLSILTGKPIKGVDTALKTHCRDNGHNVTIDNIEVIAREENSFHLRIKESLLIKRDKPQLNNNVYSTPLMLF